MSFRASKGLPCQFFTGVHSYLHTRVYIRNWLTGGTGVAEWSVLIHSKRVGPDIAAAGDRDAGMRWGGKWIAVKKPTRPHLSLRLRLHLPGNSPEKMSFSGHSVSSSCQFTPPPPPTNNLHASSGPPNGPNQHRGAGLIGTLSRTSSSRPWLGAAVSSTVGHACVHPFGCSELPYVKTESTMSSKQVLTNRMAPGWSWSDCSKWVNMC